MAKFRRNGKLKKFVAGALAVVLGVGAIAGISALVSNKADDDGKVKVNPSYSIGGLDDQGKYVESDATLYTKDAFECQGLTIKPNFDSNVQYEIFFYDEVGQFIESTGVLATTYDDKVPFFASRARLEITPVWADDVKEDEQVIKWYNKHQWTNSLEIKVDEEQKNFLDLIEDYENVAKILGQGSWSTSGGGFTQTSTPFYFFEKVDVSNADTLVMKVKTETLNVVLSYADATFRVPMMYDGTTEKVLTNYNYSIVGSADDFTYISYDVSNYTSIFGCVDVQSVDFVEIYIV